MVNSADATGPGPVGQRLSPLADPTGYLRPLADSTVAHDYLSRKLKVCIVAAKDLSWNTRVVRQARVLREAGHEVTVISLIAPAQELMATAPGTRFLTIGQMKMVIWSAIEYRLSRLRWPMRVRRNRIVRAILTILAAPVWVVRHAIRACRSILSERMPDTREDRSGLAYFLRRSLWRAWRQCRRIGQFLGQPAISRWPGRIACRLVRLARRLVRAFPAHAPMSRSIAFAQYATLALAGRDFDCVQAHDSHALRAGWKIARGRKARFVYDAVEIPDDRSGLAARQHDGLFFRLNSALEARIIRRADKIITVSDGLAQWTATRYGTERPELVRNCRFYEDAGSDERIRRAIGLRDGECLALYLNSLYSGQGLEQLVQSFSFLPDHIHIATLGPVQEKPIAEKLISLAESIGVANRFHILDPVSPTDVVSYASGADIGVIPRQNSCLNNAISLPNRVFELVMARLPIAAPSLPDMKNFVTEYGIGLSFDETDPKDIARIVSEMLRPERLGEFRTNVAAAARELCWENEGLRYRRILESVANVSAPGR